MSLVRVVAYCPVEGCDVEKNQLDFSEEHAVEVVQEAMDVHLQEEHPEWRPPS